MRGERKNRGGKGETRSNESTKTREAALCEVRRRTPLFAAAISMLIPVRRRGLNASAVYRRSQLSIHHNACTVCFEEALYAT